MPNIGELLRFHNILVKDTAPGRYYTTCPHCSAFRKPPHRKLKCLGVTIAKDRAYWGCNHCGITGPETAPPRFTYANGFKSKGDGEDRFFWRKDDESDPGPFRINEALESDGPILIAEGEKDVNTLWALGFPATCGPHGASTWKPDYSEKLKGRDIVVLNDNDDAGYKYAKLVVDCSLGVAASVRRLDLKEFWPEIGEGEDVSDWIDHGDGSTAWLETIIADLPLINGADASETPQPQQPQQASLIRRINIAAWEGKPVPEQEWTVRNRFPRGEIALLSGPGAVGKSLIALHLAVAHVLGRDWLGAIAELGPAIFIEAEDRETVLWRRSEALRQHYATTFAELQQAGLHLFSLHAQNSIMATVGRDGVVRPTELLLNFRKLAGEIKPQLVVLPATANIFAGNENDRSQVSQFIHLLGAIADEINGCVLLITHPSLSGGSKNGATDHFGLSGSTAWHNGPRARAVLSAAADQDESGQDGHATLRKLEFFKNQYGTAEESITLRYDSGMLKPESSGTPYEIAAREAGIDAAFMATFNRLSSIGQTIGAERFSRNHPAALFANEAEIKAAKISKQDLINAVQRLIDKGSIRVDEYGKASNRHKRLVVP